MYPMYSLLNLKTPALGLRISETDVRDPGTVATRAQDPPILRPLEWPEIWCDPRITLKCHQTSSQSPGNERHANLCQGHSKSWKMDSGTMTNTASAKVDFWIMYRAKCLVSNPRHPDPDPKIIRKNWKQQWTNPCFWSNVPNNFRNGILKSTRSRW